jgi:lysophospholipase L1-like esterase
MTAIQPVHGRAMIETKQMVALVFGQSNSANYGQGHHRACDQVFNLYQGQLYPAQDPLLGADGEGASVWPRLGDRLIAAGIYGQVIFVAIGVGGTAIVRWVPGRDLHGRILAAIAQVQAAGLTLTHLLWHQGEADAYSLNTPPHQYQTAFGQMLGSIRAQGVTAPIYVCLATRFGTMERHEPIRAAQLGLVNGEDIRLGPDTDQLGFAYRYDGAHFSAAGLDRFAELWLDVLKP